MYMKGRMKISDCFKELQQLQFKVFRLDLLLRGRFKEMYEQDKNKWAQIAAKETGKTLGWGQDQLLESDKIIEAWRGLGL